MQLGLPMPIINHTQKKSGRGRGLAELPKTWRFPYDIYAMAVASSFKFGIQLGFSEAIIKSHTEQNVRVALA